MNGVPVEQFTSAVTRLGELRESGLVRVGKAPTSRSVVLAIDKAADDLPPRGGGLYAEIVDVLSAIAADTPCEQFAHVRTVPQPGLDAREEEAALRAKFQAAEAAFPPRTLKGGLRRRAADRIKRRIVSSAIALARRSGRLHRLMGSYRFAKALGPDGRRMAWQTLGADIHSTAGIGPQVMLRVPQHVSIGAGSLLRGKVTIESYGEVTIGRNVMLNNAIAVFSAQHDIDDPSLKGEIRTVSIGDYAWLPRQIIVLPGVRIGSYAVIGTGSVVSRDVPDYGVAVGNPARVVRERARIRYTYVPTFLDRPSAFE